LEFPQQKIESITNFQAVDGTTNPNKLKDKREIAGLIGIGFDHKFSNNISIKTEFTHRRFKKAVAPVWGDFRQASTDKYNLNLLSIGKKKNF
jgi:opacity protein-like surface antigen